MIDYRGLEKRLVDALGLARRPVAVAFRDAPLPGVAKFTGTAPSGCSFWPLAMRGRVFFTVPADHYNCAVGSYTHNIPLPPERAQELPQTLTFMAGLGYLKMEEVPGISQLPRTPGAVVYAPLGDTPVDPDVVLFVGRPRPLMLLQETALRAGVGARVPFLARPTCMALPAALDGGAVASTGCVGNRVYTDLSDDELYVALPGRDLVRVVDEVATIALANTTLSDYHRRRRRELTRD
jgi:uncharacterized protein (DUF169 family)